jgi:hypothetical protein
MFWHSLQLGQRAVSIRLTGRPRDGFGFHRGGTDLAALPRLGRLAV